MRGGARQGAGGVGPQTTSQRQQSLRARRAAEGMAEVRGIYLPQAQHAHIKRLAALLGKPTEPPKEQT